MLLAGILVIALIVLIIILMTGQTSGYKISKSAGKEEFGDILGALGPYKSQLAASDDQIRQTDPSLRLQPNNAWNAGLYARSVFTDMAKNKVPPEKPITNSSKCKKQCASKDPLASQKCEGVCVTRESVKRWCDIQCAYTDEPLDQCLKGCMETKLVNGVSSTWVFYDH
jgi:hypothetical protein